MEPLIKKYNVKPTAINIEVIKAYRNLQSEYDKHKALEAQSQQTRMVSNIMADPEAFVARAEKEHAPKWIEKYRQTYPAKSELMTDAAIVEECRQIAINEVKGQISIYQVKLKEESNSRRDELMRSLSASDKPFASEIGRILKNLPDVQVVDKNFTFHDIVRWARGDEKNMKRLIQEAEERGRKQAMSGEIIGEKFVAKTPATSRPKTQASKPAASQLTDYEKKRAREMFSSGYDTDEGCYEAYIDVVKKRSKKQEEVK